MPTGWTDSERGAATDASGSKKTSLAPAPRPPRIRTAATRYFRLTLSVHTALTLKPKHHWPRVPAPLAIRQGSARRDFPPAATIRGPHSARGTLLCSVLRLRPRLRLLHRRRHCAVGGQCSTAAKHPCSRGGTRCAAAACLCGTGSTWYSRAPPGCYLLTRSKGSDTRVLGGTSVGAEVSLCPSPDPFPMIRSLTQAARAVRRLHRSGAVNTHVQADRRAFLRCDTDAKSAGMLWP